MSEKVLPKRSELDPQYTWNKPSVFESDEAWREVYVETQALLPNLQAFQGTLNQGAQQILGFFETLENVMMRLEKLYVYAGMSSAVDVNDQKSTAMAGQARLLYSQVMAAVAFSRPELLAIGSENLAAWVKADERLAVFAHSFDDLFRQQSHVQSSEIEAILGMVVDPFMSASNTVGMLTNADFKFKAAVGDDGQEKPLSQSTIDALLNSGDRELRRTAWEHYADTYLAFKNTLSSSYITSVKQGTFFSQVRGYESTLEAALFPNNVPVEVFHNLIETYKKHIPTWHRYWAIRRRALGVETLNPYDIWAPIAKEQPVVPYHQAVEWISESLKPLGDEYVNALRQGCLQDRWVDVYPNQGKSAGAFSSGAKSTFPFIMMSYHDNLESMSTLTHELGHSMHSYLTWKNQPYLYSEYSMFVAEVASNFNQAMTRAYLFETMPDPNFQIALIEEAMSNFHRYFFIMPTLARFEYEVHRRVGEGQSPSADELISLMTELFSEGYGGEMHIDHERIGITWAQFGHLYVNFYTFQYATGISGAHALSHAILNGEDGAAEAYLQFLKSGSSDYPVNVLKQAGVDLSTPAAVEKTFEVLASLIDRLDTLTR